MWRIVCFGIAVLCNSFVYSQCRFHFEPTLSTQYCHHIHCKLENKDPHRGVTFSPGIRFNYDLTKKVTLVASVVTKNLAGEVQYPIERVYSINAKYHVAHFRNAPNVQFITETGIGYNVTAKHIEVPLYIGTSVALNPILTWNTRVNLAILKKNEDGTFNYGSYGVDMGLAMRFCAVAPTRTRHGNPFILQ
jgi:hypothetical protein